MKTLLSLSILAALATGALAQTFNTAADFSDTQNPAGVWRYGRKTLSITDTFSLNTTFASFQGIGDSWMPDSTRPAIGLLASDRGNGDEVAPAGTMFLHTGIPGTEDELAVVRWTAPSAGTVSISGRFYAGDGGQTDDYVVKNGVALFSVADTALSQSFSLSSSVVAGDTIEFIVGPGTDGADSDLTPLNGTIRLTSSVPEPATMAILGMGALALLRRRRGR